MLFQFKRGKDSLYVLDSEVAMISQSTLTLKSGTEVELHAGEANDLLMTILAQESHPQGWVGRGLYEVKAKPFDEPKPKRKYPRRT